jgi:hypothetical protein
VCIAHLRRNSGATPDFWAGFLGRFDFSAQGQQDLINNRQAGRRRGRGGQRPQGGNSGRGPENGNRIDNRARGNAAQLLEKYKTLARDSQMQGDRVNTEYYLQFADHYFRVLAETRSRFEENQQRRPRDEQFDTDGDDDEFDSASDMSGDDRGDGFGNERPANERSGNERSGKDRGDHRDGGRNTERDRDRDGNRAGQRDGAPANRPNVDRQNPDRANPGREHQGRNAQAPTPGSAEANGADEAMPVAENAVERPRRGRPRRAAAPAEAAGRGGAGNGAGGSDGNHQDDERLPMTIDADQLPPMLGLSVLSEEPAEKPRRRRARTAADEAAPTD